MRRKPSTELPQFANHGRSLPPLPFRMGRRSQYIILGIFLFLCWFFFLSRTPTGHSGTSHVNWSYYAYSLSATDTTTLCHALLVFDALARFGSKADRVLFYPEQWDTKVDSAADRDSQLLVMARDTYKVKLHPIKPLSVEGRTADEWTGAWDKSVTKLAAFSLEYYDRVIVLDSDITLLQHLDELFHLPETPMAMPRAYWAPQKPWPLASTLMVIKPNAKEFDGFKHRLEQGGDNTLVKAHRFDMEIINERFEDSALILPHRPYILPTSEFRQHNHSTYMGSPDELWDAGMVYKEAKMVYFSDWPLPKPWIMWPIKGLEEMQPDCGGSHEGSCPERRIWKALYDDFRHKRKDICKLLSAAGPPWSLIKEKGHAWNGIDV